MTVSNAITDLKNNTEYNKAQQPQNYSSKMTSSDFLYLLTQQLQYQDPMNPMDNTEMLAQEAQFSTLEQMESLTSSFTQFSNIYQANSLMGQTVEVGEGNSKVKGVVDYIDMTDAKGASISVNGKLYPLSQVSKIYPEESNTNEKNFLLSSIYNIGENIAGISSKLATYLGLGESNDSTSKEEETTQGENIQEQQ